MKTSNEIRAAIKEQNTALEALEELAKKEDRNLTDDETKTYDEGVSNLDKLNTELERVAKNEEVRKQAARNANIVGGASVSKESKEEKEVKRRYSLSRAIMGGFNEKLDGVEREMHEEAKREFARNSNIVTNGNIFVPQMLMTRANITENNTAGIDVGLFEGGLHAQSVTNGWAQNFQSVSDLRIPVITATALAWEGETDAAADGGSALSKLDLSPTRMSGYVHVSKQTLMQHNQSVEAALIDDIQRAVSAKLDYAIFTADSPGPTDIKNGKTEVEKSSANELAMALIEEVMGNNALKGNLGFISSHSLFAEIMTAVQVSGVSPLITGMNIGGYPVRFTSQAEVVDTTKETIYFGDWSQLAICQFGGLDILVDPYSQAKNGMNAIVLNAFYDFGLKQAAGISVGAFTGTNI